MTGLNKLILQTARALGQETSAAIAGGMDRTDAMHAAFDEVMKNPDLVELASRNEKPRQGRDDVPPVGFGDILPFLPSLGLAWAESGFPTIEIGQRLAASLVCTSVPGDLLGDISPPWRCFVLRAPEDLLPDIEFTIVLFPRPHEFRREISTYTFGRNYVDFGHEPTMADLAYKFLDRDWVFSGTVSDHTQVIARQLAMIGRLIVGTCIEMDSPHQITETNRRSGSHVKRDKRGEPTNWTIKLTRPVRADMRDAVRSYLSGERRGAMSTQHMVRGHHKQQTCGHGGAERKWIHVEPYWRGDPDAPIAVRPHTVQRAARP